MTIIDSRLRDELSFHSGFLLAILIPERNFYSNNNSNNNKLISKYYLEISKYTLYLFNNECNSLTWSRSWK
jgi:hypothetical protein